MIDNTTMASNGSANTNTPAHPLGQAASFPLCPHKEAILHPVHSFDVSTGIQFLSILPAKIPKIGYMNKKNAAFFA